MGAKVRLREDFDSTVLWRLAHKAKDAKQVRRLIALSVIYDGGSRTDAAKAGGVGLQVIRDWVIRFNDAGPDGLIDRKSPGRARKLNEAQRRKLAQIVKEGPIPAIHDVVRWRLKDLASWIHEEFGISLDETTVSRELKVLGFSKITARPQHRGQSETAIEDFKKTFRTNWKQSAVNSRPIRP